MPVDLDQPTGVVAPQIETVAVERLERQVDVRLRTPLARPAPQPHLQVVEGEDPGPAAAAPRGVQADVPVLPPPPPRRAAPPMARLAPLPPPAGWRDAAAASEPVVQVTIGRVEVKADPSAKQTAPARAEPAVSTLDAYLARRAQERAGR